MKKMCIYILLISNILAGCSDDQQDKFYQQQYNDEEESLREQIDNETQDLQEKIHNGQEQEVQIFKEEENINSEDYKAWTDNLEEHDEGKRQTNGQIEVSVERISKPITNDNGQILATVYYERPVVSGNTEAVEKINCFFEQEEQDWFEGRLSRLTLYGD